MEALSSGAVKPDTATLSNAVHGYLDSLTQGLTRVSDADVLAELRELEVLRRRLAVADHALIAEIDRRGLVGQLAMSSTRRSCKVSSGSRRTRRSTGFPPRGHASRALR